MMQTEEGRRALEAQRRVFVDLAELEKTAPADVNSVVRMMVEHIRTWKPQVLSALITQDPPQP